jgi:hypothetical protein
MFEGLENLDLDLYDHEFDGHMRHSRESLCAHPLNGGRSNDSTENAQHRDIVEDRLEGRQRCLVRIL